jgi:Tfp pilus assembly protein PilN
MRNELTNLLPEERQRALRRDYFLRLGIVIIAFFIALTCAAAILLLPTYVFLAESQRAKETHLASIESVLSSSDESALSAQLAALSNDAATLESLSGAPSVSETIVTALAISRPGITLSGFSYSPGTGDNPGTLAISGTAETRDALRNYQLALQSAPFAQSANLPVSAYANDTDIAFTITVTLAP